MRINGRIKKMLRNYLLKIASLLSKNNFQEYKILRELNSWVVAGKVGAPPISHKRYMIEKNMSLFGIDFLVETGTCSGDTVEQFRHKCSHVWSIEIDTNLFNKAQRRFSNINNVTVLLGDSGDILKKIIPELHEPALFWLDGHYSGEITGRGDKDTPIFKELEAILSASHKHCVMIDDARCFDGTGDYPTIDTLMQVVLTKRPDYLFWVHNDIIYVLPGVRVEPIVDVRRKEFLRWTKKRGDQSLRYRYPLNERSIVWDVGAYDGDFTEGIIRRYDCKSVLMFEPAEDKHDSLVTRFEKSSKVALRPYGLGAVDRYISLSMEEDGSSAYGGASEKSQRALLRAIKDVYEEEGGGAIDLCKINIEGGEYELIEDMLRHDIAKNIANLQIQFHPWYPYADNRKDEICRELRKTHICEWKYDYIWESWRKK